MANLCDNADEKQFRKGVKQGSVTSGLIYNKYTACKDKNLLKSVRIYV
jgi:hypothetical protein